MLAFKIIAVVACLLVAFLVMANFVVRYVYDESGKKTYYEGAITDISLGDRYVMIVTPSNKIILQRSSYCKLSKFRFVPGNYTVITDNKGRFKEMVAVKASTQ